MKDHDVERLLLRLTPRDLGTAVRPQVLAAVARELRKEPASSLTGRFAWVVAAALLFGILLNVWVVKSTENRLAQLFGRPPVSKQAKELADTIESVAGAQSARWVYERCAAARSSGDGRLAYEAYCECERQLANELTNPFNEIEHENSQKDLKMDRNRRGRPRGDRTDCQRPLRLDYRFTA